MREPRAGASRWVFATLGVLNQVPHGPGICAGDDRCRGRFKLLPSPATARSGSWKLPSRFPQSRIADHAQATSAATARVPVVAIGWKPKGIARPQELLVINRADLERAGDTQDELLGPDLVRPRPVIARDR